MPLDLEGTESDVWLTVHRNSVWIRNQLDVTLCYPLFLLYKLFNMFRATMCPSSGADELCYKLLNGHTTC